MNKLDEDGYPTEEALNAIEKWNLDDAHNLICFIEEMWAYKEWGFKKSWGRDRFKNRVLFLELHTAGWSGNESIINALQKNKMFFMLWWAMSKRGGHYWFEVDLRQVGFKTGVCRQAIHQSMEKYETIGTPKKLLLRELK
jgi:hypothetical protein